MDLHLPPKPGILAPARPALILPHRHIATPAERRGFKVSMLPGFMGLPGFMAGASGRPSTLLATAMLASPYVEMWTVNGTTFNKVTGPTVGAAASNGGQAVVFSPDGKVLAVGHDGSPYMSIYDITAGPTFTKKANPANLPQGPANNFGFTLDGQFMAEGDNGGPQENVYAYDPTLVRVGSTGSFSGECQDVKFSPDGSILLVASDTSPFVRQYAVSGAGVLSGGTFTGTQPSVLTNTIAWHPNGNLVFIGGGSSGFSTSFNLYTRSGSAFTRISNPATVPGSTNGISGAAFSPDGGLLALACGSTPFVYLYSVSVTTLTYLGSPAVIPASARVSASFSADGALLALIGLSSPMIVYQVSGTTFTSITAPAGQTTNTRMGCFN